MARYFKKEMDPEKGGGSRSYPRYGVISDKPSSVSPDFGNIHPYGYINFNYDQVQETPNRFNRQEGDNTPLPTELFRNSPEKLTVTSMFADRRVRPHMMTLMALAKQDYPTARLESASHLSQFSSRLSKNAHERGLVSPHEYNTKMETDDTGDVDTAYEQTSDVPSIENVVSGFTAVKDIPHSDVMAGKQFLKQMIRPVTEQKTPKYNAKQPQLPGMEDK